MSRRLLEELCPELYMLCEDYNIDLYIYGTCGPKGVGKTTYANQIALSFHNSDKNRYAFVMSFANELKEEVNQAFKYIGIDVNKVDKETIRPVYQIVGDLRRDNNKNYYVERLLDLICTKISLEVLGLNKETIVCDDAQTREVYVCIDDVRFENEARICDRLEELKRDGVDYTEEHSTETRLPDHLIDQVFHLY